MISRCNVGKCVLIVQVKGAFVKCKMLSHLSDSTHTRRRIQRHRNQRIISLPWLFVCLFFGDGVLENLALNHAPSCVALLVLLAVLVLLFRHFVLDLLSSVVSYFLFHVVS